MDKLVLIGISAMLLCGMCFGQSGEISAIIINPETPAADEKITLTLSGLWDDSCVPSLAEVQLDGNKLYIEIYRPPLMGPCLAVISDWKITKTIDPLDAGEYEIFVRFRNLTEYEFFLSFDVSVDPDNGYWPPMAVIVKPANPKPGQPVSLVMEGQWLDTCVPTSMDISRIGPSILVDVQLEYEPDTGCGDAITPYRLEGEIGPLPAGQYTVYARIAENPMVPSTTYRVVKEFTVRSEDNLKFYRFLPEESSVLQTGGFAGIEKLYSIEGYFGLRLNYESGKAQFVEVDATLSPDGYLPTTSLGKLFNMENLESTSLSETGIRFEGMTQGHDIAPVVIEVGFGDAGITLFGTIVPGCCDRFNYRLDAFAVPIETPFCRERPKMDFTNDCKVDMDDLAVFAQSWLVCNLIPQSDCW